MLPLSLSNVLAVVVLLCAVLQICQRQVQAMLKLSQFAAFVLGVATFWQAIAQDEWVLYGVGFVIIVGQGLVLPNALSRIMVRFKELGETRQVLPMVWSMLVGLLSVCVALIAGMPDAKISIAPEAGIMCVALAIILLGVWLVIIQTQIITQMLGALTIENGLVLALVNGSVQSWVLAFVLIALLSVMASLIFLANSLYAERTKTMANGTDL